jgi:hypothetical protein
VKRQRESLAAWHQSGREDGTMRARLSAALRELLTQIVLPTNPHSVTLRFGDGRIEDADIRPLVAAFTSTS